MRRREILSGAAALGMVWPLEGRAENTSVIGFLHSGSPEPNAGRLARFRKGLRDAGFIEGQNVVIEYRWATGQVARLQEMAEDLVARKVRLIATLSSTPAAVAARAATSAVPIFFLIAEPPVELGLVATLNRPGGNATGITTMALELSAKRFDLLRELTTQAPMAALFNRSHPGAKPTSDLLDARARSLGIALQKEYADTDAEIDTAFASFAPGTSLIVVTSPFFFVRRQRLAALAANRRVPAIYDNPEYTHAGGLMSYGPNPEALWEQAGGAVARILRGERPAEFPVAQASAFELVVNARVARDLNLAIPPSLLARADEVIE
jgi:putative ABC transport system substrate-binding protein